MNLDVVLESLSFNYRNFKALNNVSFSLSQGNIYGLIGRNGAGKTTLLSLLASFNYPTSGSIKIGGEIPFENSKIMPLVTFMYEVDYSDEDETIWSYFEASERYKPSFDIEYAKELAGKFKLPLDKPIHKLSKGMQSAFNATLGLASRSPVTIFDEVYQGMDAPTREIFYKELLEDQGRFPRIIILSTHLVSEMDYLFDHVLILDKGSMLIDEPIDKILSRGVSITGDVQKVDAFSSGMQVLNEQRLGGTKSVTVYGEIVEEDLRKATELGLEVGPVSLQDLFIYLTEEEG